MKLQKEYVILAVVIAALTAYLVVHNTNRTNYKLPQFAEISDKQVSKLAIEKNGNTIVLNKINDSWYIRPGQYRADRAKVKDMLDKIATISLTALVSESKNYLPYDLTDDRKITVKAWTGETLARDLEIGKTAPSFNHTFVKLAGDDRVYHARGSFKNTFDYTIDDLRDKTVLAFDPDDIGEIQIDKKGRKIVLNRSTVPKKGTRPKTDKAAKSAPTPKTMQTIWQTAEGRPIDTVRLNRLLTTLDHLHCQEYITDKKKGDLTQPLLSILLKGSQDHSLTLFDKTTKEAQNYPAISSGSDDPFRLSNAQAENILKVPEDIFKAK